jgi:hypothetical protein
VIVQSLRLSDGTRKITSICEVTGMEGETITLQEIFVFKQTGVAKDGKVEGYFTATGVRPRFWERMTTRGVEALRDAVHAGAPRRLRHSARAWPDRMDSPSSSSSCWVSWPWCCCWKASTTSGRRSTAPKRAACRTGSRP